MRLEPGAEDARFRLRQAERVIDIVRSRARAGELPPIVVGDFNHHRDYHGLGGDPERTSDRSVQLMERYFWRPVDSNCDWIGKWNNIDIVYIARTPAFPGPPPCHIPAPELDSLVPRSEGHFEAVGQRRVWMHHQVRIGEVDLSLCTARLRFDHPIDPESFSVADTAPQAFSVEVAGDQGECFAGEGRAGRKICEKCERGDVCKLDVTYPRPLCGFRGLFRVGPLIESREGFTMDQNGDGWARGQARDAYHFGLGRCVCEDGTITSSCVFPDGNEACDHGCRAGRHDGGACSPGP